MEPTASKRATQIKDIRVNLQRISKDVICSVPTSMKFAAAGGKSPVSIAADNDDVEVSANQGGSVSMEVEPGENCSLNFSTKTASPNCNVTLQLHEPGEYKFNIVYKHHGSRSEGQQQLKSQTAGSSNGKVNLSRGSHCGGPSKFTRAKEIKQPQSWSTITASKWSSGEKRAGKKTAVLKTPKAKAPKAKAPQVKTGKPKPSECTVKLRSHSR